MEKDFLENLYRAFKAQNDYLQFILSFLKDETKFSEDDIKLLQVIYAGFYIMVIYDKYTEKIDENNIIFHLHPTFIEKMIQIVATKVGDRYAVGDLTYKSASDVLIKLRNKLAHGDFIIKDDYVIFTEKNVEGRIKISALLEFIIEFENNCEDFYLYNNQAKIFNFHTLKKNFIHIKRETDIDKVCRKVYRLEITSRPIGIKSKDLDYFIQMIAIYKEIEYMIRKYYPITVIKDKLYELKQKLKNNFIDFDFKIEPYTDLSYYPEIKKQFMKRFELYKDAILKHQVVLLSNLANYISDCPYNKLNITNGIFVNEIILKQINTIPNLCFDNIVPAKLEDAFLCEFNEVVISMCLASFNSLYTYGLEKVFTNFGNTNIVDLYNNIKLDFSQFDLSLLDDPNMSIEKTLDIKFEQYVKSQMQKCDDTIIHHTSNLDQYKSKAKIIKIETINKHKEKIEKAEEEKTRMIYELINMSDFISQFLDEKYKKYIRNINIIYHIRNAIAHGQIFLGSYCTNLCEQKIKIVDYKNGEIVYQKEVNLDEFNSLFNAHNSEILRKFYQQCVLNFKEENNPAKIKIKKL